MSTTIGTLEIEMAANIARLSADLGAARNEVNRTMGEIQRSVSSMQDGIQSGMNGVTAAFGKVNIAIAAITTALAGGAAFKSAVEETVNMTKEANALGKSLGISATEASILNIALGDIYQSSDTMLAANKAMTKQLVSNEDAFKSLGVATRDQNGHYRNSLDIMLGVNGRLLAFREGTDRNIEGMKVYGKAWGEVQGILKLNTELMEASRTKARELGLAVGAENVEATARYRAAMNDVGDVISAVRKTIGDAMLPRLAETANWFANIGPQAVEVMRVVMETFVSVSSSVSTVVSAAWNAIADVFATVVEAVKAALGDGSPSISGMQLFKNMCAVVEIAVIALRTGFQESFAAIGLAVELVVIGLKEFGQIAAAALRLDWAGVKQAWADGSAAAAEAIERNATRMSKAAAQARQDIGAAVDRAYADPKKPTPTQAKTGGQQSSGKTDSGSKPKSRIKDFEAGLVEIKAARDRENDLNHTFFEFSKEQERAYWQNILQTRNLSKEERIAVERKLLDASLAVHKEAAQAQQEEIKRQIDATRAGSLERVQLTMQAAAKIGEQYGLESREYRKAQDEVRRAAIERSKEIEKLEQMQVDARRNASLHGLAMERDRLSQSKQLGDISGAEELAALRDLEERKYRIELKAAEDRAALVAADPIAYQQAMDKIAQIKQQHDLEMQRNSAAMALEQRQEALQMFQPVTNAFEKSINGMIQGTLTFSQAMRNMAQSIVLEFVNMGVKMVAQWLAAEAAKTLASRTGTAVRSTLEQSAAVASKSIAVTSANVEIGAKAAGAAAGAAQSQASIPFAGWGLAAAAFASVMALVLGAKSVVASAAGGFDIPAGLNPMTQLHEREMVLPAEHADTIRGLSGTGGQQPINIQLSTFDTQGVKRFLMDNGNVIADSLRAQARNFKTV
jgi:hypothetical protein